MFLDSPSSDTISARKQRSSSFAQFVDNHLPHQLFLLTLPPTAASTLHGVSAGFSLWIKVRELSLYFLAGLLALTLSCLVKEGFHPSSGWISQVAASWSFHSLLPSKTLTKGKAIYVHDLERARFFKDDECLNLRLKEIRYYFKLSNLKKAPNLLPRYSHPFCKR